MNIEYGDEVDGAMPMVQVNMETSDQPSLLSSLQVTVLTHVKSECS